MHQRNVVVVLLFVGLLAPASYSYFKEAGAGTQMTKAAAHFLNGLDAKKRAVAQLEYASEHRVGWHFIPKDERKGLEVKRMTPAQRQAVHALLQSALSEVGYDQATKIMQLEALLHMLEGGKGSNIRDPERYYVTIFGEPTGQSRWGLSFEGHHLSLNFVVEGDRVVSSTPQFFATNPGEVKGDIPASDRYPDIKQGVRVLAAEELMAFSLINSLDDAQQAVAIIAKKAPREIRAAGETHPPTAAAEGITAAKLNEKQQKQLRSLIGTYAGKMPYEVAAARLAAIDEAGFGKVHFAWAGALKEGVGHYYRVQGPTFLIELVNTQPDAAGNPANHVHCVWRDTAGDFALPIEK
jgi:hypothetical protein